VWLCAAAAYAEDGPDYARSGIYVGLGGSYAFDMAVEDELQAALDALGYTDVDVDVKGSPGVNARAGYRYSPHLAGELQLEYLTGFDSELLSVKFVEHEILALTANLKVPILTGRIQPFVLAGAGLVYAKAEDTVGADLSESDTGFGIRAGGGVDVYATENVAVSVDATYVVPFGDIEDFDFLSIGFGIQYRF
jgi:opacity protein-like surface antigen